MATRPVTGAQVLSFPVGSGGTTTVTPVAVTTGSSTPVVASEPRVLHVATAQLPVLPDPLCLTQGPLLVTIETWSDATVVARVPFLSLHAEGATDTEAINRLGWEILDFYEDTAREVASGTRLGGTMLEQWLALTAMVRPSSTP